MPPVVPPRAPLRRDDARTRRAAAAETLCAPCFDALRELREAARFAALPALEGACFDCGTAAGPLRDPMSGGLAMCAACYAASAAQQHARDVGYVPKQTTVPDEALAGVLFISDKDGQANAATLARLRISRVLICCDRLPPYHDVARAGLRFHRLAIGDSLEQNLTSYLPAALAFIAAGALVGERTLVHCNAGISRSGAVLVAFLRAAVPLSTTDAFAAAMGARAAVSPNQNFLRQLGYAAPTLAAAADANSAATSAGARACTAGCGFFASVAGGMCTRCTQSAAAGLGGVAVATPAALASNTSLHGGAVRRNW